MITEVRSYDNLLQESGFQVSFKNIIPKRIQLWHYGLAMNEPLQDRVDVLGRGEEVGGARTELYQNDQMYIRLQRVFMFLISFGSHPHPVRKVLFISLCFR